MFVCKRIFTLVVNFTWLTFVCLWLIVKKRWGQRWSILLITIRFMTLDDGCFTDVYNDDKVSILRFGHSGMSQTASPVSIADADDDDDVVVSTNPLIFGVFVHLAADASLWFYSLAKGVVILRKGMLHIGTLGRLPLSLFASFVNLNEDLLKTSFWSAYMRWQQLVGCFVYTQHMAEVPYESTKDQFFQYFDHYSVLCWDIEPTTRERLRLSGVAMLK